MSQSAKALIGDAGFARLKQYLIEATGLAYYQAKDDELAAPLSARLTALTLRDCDAYRELLQSGPAGEQELDLLVADLTIGETSFFRHREQFQALRELVIPDLLRRKQSLRRLRIWSAGCATGAEPYSLAILLSEWEQTLEGWDVNILGTDINRGYLAAAQRGEFNAWAFRSAPEDIRERCFSPHGNHWKILPKHQQWVSFQCHNLAQHPFPSLIHNLSAFDLILCRNVMIYFHADIVARGVSQFHDCLSDGGWLLVGHAECNVELFRSFQTINFPGAVLYQKSGKLSPPPVTALPNPWQFPSPVAAQPAVPIVASPPPLAPDLRTLMDAGQWDDARRRCEQLVEREPLNPRGHFFQALLREREAQHAEAEQSLKRAIYLDRSFALAHYYLGQLERRRHDLAAARRSFNNVLRLLSTTPTGQAFAEADDLTAGDLLELTRMHLELLND